MSLRGSNFLGIAIAERAITCAQVSVAGDRRAVQQTSVFEMPAELSLEKPDALGQALASFLRQKGFSSSRAVVGIPARWLMAVEKEIPPADETQARAALRLQAERIAPSESGDLVFDFAGTSSTATATHVLLIGTLKTRLDNVQNLMEAAGMNVLAITSTGLTLAAVANHKSSDSKNNSPILLLNRGGTEMIWRQGGTPKMLRHIPVTQNGHGLPAIAPLGAEVHRAVNLAYANGKPVSEELLIIDGVGVPQDQLTQLESRAGVRVRVHGQSEQLGDIPASLGTNGENGGQYLPAVALAIAGASRQLPIDFRHSRLAPPAPRRISRKMLWSVIIGSAVLLSIVSLFAMVRSRQNELDVLQDQLKQMKPEITDAQALVDRVNYARGFFPGPNTATEAHRPQVLECLREITNCFRDEDRVWVTTFVLHDTGKGTIGGKASDQRGVFAILDRIKKNPRFIDAALGGTTQEDTRSHDVSFTINFTFNFASTDNGTK